MLWLVVWLLAAAAHVTGTYIPGTYSLIGTSPGRFEYGVHYVTYTVTEDGKVEVIDVMHVNTHGWGGTAELSENDTGEYEDYPYKITGGSYKWELARFSPDPNNPSKAILDVRHYNPSFCCTGSGSSAIDATTAPTVTPAPTVSPLIADDATIRTAVAAWLSDRAAAEATYGPISRWETGGVTEMSYLFCASSYYCSTTSLRKTKATCLSLLQSPK